MKPFFGSSAIFVFFSSLFLWGSGGLFSQEENKGSWGSQTRVFRAMTLNTGGASPGVFEYDPGEKNRSRVHDRIIAWAVRDAAEEKGIPFSQLLQGQLVEWMQKEGARLGLSLSEQEALIHFVQAKQEEKALAYLYQIPEEILSSCEKILKDDEEIDFNTTYGTLDTQVPLQGSLIASQKALLTQILGLSAYPEEETKAKILHKIEEKGRKEIKGRPDEALLSVLASAKGRLFLYGLWQCALLEQVLGANSPLSIDDVNREKELWAQGFRLPVKANTLAQTIFHASPSVLFTQEADPALCALLEEKYVSHPSQDRGDGTLVFLNPADWKQISEVRSSLQVQQEPKPFPIQKADHPHIGESLSSPAKMNFVTAVHRNSEEPFLFVAAHAKSGGQADSAIAQLQKIQEIARTYFPHHKVVIGIDANTEHQKGGSQEFQTFTQSRPFSVSHCPYTTDKTRLVTTQFSKQCKRVQDEKDYLIGANGAAIDASEVLHTGSWMSAQHPSDHGPVVGIVRF